MILADLPNKGFKFILIWGKGESVTNDVTETSHIWPPSAVEKCQNPESVSWELLFMESGTTLGGLERDRIRVDFKTQ